MEESLLKRIQRAYPDRTIYGLNKDVLEDAEQDSSIESVLKRTSRKCHLDWTVQPGSKPDYCIIFNRLGHPHFDKWTWEMSNSSKIQWIKQNGAPYSVLVLRISRVAKYYCVSYNHWTQRGDTGYLDMDCNTKPNSEWLESEAVLKTNLDNAGFQHLSDALMFERTSIVRKRDHDSISNDDDFEPPWIDCSLRECLFSHCDRLLPFI